MPTDNKIGLWLDNLDGGNIRKFRFRRKATVAHKNEDGSDSHILASIYQFNIKPVPLGRDIHEAVGMFLSGEDIMDAISSVDEFRKLNAAIRETEFVLAHDGTGSKSAGDEVVSKEQFCDWTKKD